MRFNCRYVSLLTFCLPSSPSFSIRFISLSLSLLSAHRSAPPHSVSWKNFCALILTPSDRKTYKKMAKTMISRPRMMYFL